MSVFTHHTTAEQLLTDYPDQYCELIAGELHFMTPPGWMHGLVAAKIAVLLGGHILEKQLGRSFGAETGFLISREPDTVRAPDFALVLEANYREPDSRRGYWPGAPDFLVEVLSPNDRRGYVSDKVEMWLEAGCQLVWVVDPEKQTVTVHSRKEEAKTYECGAELRDDNLLQGFSCQVDALFE